MLRWAAVSALWAVGAAGCGESQGDGESSSGGAIAAGAGDAGPTGGTTGGSSGSTGHGGVGGTGSTPSGGKSSGGSAAGGATHGGSAGSPGGAPGACGERDSLGPKLYVSVLDPNRQLAAGVHEGRAVVERSTNTELVLTFEPRDAGTTPESAGSGGDGGTAAAAAVFHAKFTGVPDAARFAPGAQLWLTLLYSVPTSWFTPPPAWSASIRDRENGTLLFGASYNDFDSAAAPIQVGARMPTCMGPSPDTQCAPTATVTYSSLEVLGDETVVVDDSATETVMLGGVPYDVRIHAQQQSSTDPPRCVDYVAPGGVTLDIGALHLDELVKTLDVDTAPACSQGNDPSIAFDFSFYGVDSETTYEGPIAYRGRDPNNEGAYEFDAPGLTGTTDLAPTVSIVGAAGLLPEPAVGQEFWLSYQGTRVHALRESQSGPVLLAQGWSFGTEVQRLATDFGNVLGVPMRVEDVCEYTPVSPLRDTIFETVPEVRVPSGTAGTLVIDGHTSRVWTWSEGSQSITIYPAN